MGLWLVSLLLSRCSCATDVISDTLYTNGDRLSRGKDQGTPSLSLLRCTFIGCTGEANAAGGAIWYAAVQGPLICKNCTFAECSAPTGWGAAVFYRSTLDDFVFDNCTVLNMQTRYSVIHVQRGENSDTFTSLTLTGNKFQGIAVTESDQCGGSGLAFRHVGTLRLIECKFTRCNTTGAGGGALLFNHREVLSLSFEVVLCKGQQINRPGAEIGPDFRPDF